MIILQNTNLKVNIDDYIPILNENDECILVDFIVELFNVELSKDSNG